MEIEDLRPLISDLSSHIDDLETAVAPLLKTPLATNASKLPLLDQAKLYVLATYALESLLFSSLRISGVDAKDHPVFKELARVKQYFGKIKAAETAGAKRSTTLDKDAAGRFIRHALSRNDRLDADRGAREQGGAKRKLEDLHSGTHVKFDDRGRKRRAGGGEASEVDTDGGDTLGGPGTGDESAAAADAAATQGKGRDSKKLRRFERELARRNAQEDGPLAEDATSGNLSEQENSFDARLRRARGDAWPAYVLPSNHLEELDSLFRKAKEYSGSIPLQKKKKRNKHTDKD